MTNVIYNKRRQRIRKKLKKIKTEKEDNNKNRDVSDENIPKFISEFEKKNKE